MARKQKATKVVKVLKKKEEELTEERKQELTDLVADQVNNIMVNVLPINTLKSMAVKKVKILTALTNKESQFLDSLDILLKVK